MNVNISQNCHHVNQKSVIGFFISLLMQLTLKPSFRKENAKGQNAFNWS